MLQIEHNGKKWVATLSIDQKKKVIDAGFIWDERENKWGGGCRKAYRLFDHVVDRDKDFLLSSLGIKITKAPDHVLYPSHRNLVPFKHQLEGVQWILSRRASYIAYEAGLGKSALAPLCINTIDGPTLIICPSFLKLNWEDELENWLIDFHHIQILKKQNDKVNPNADIYIVPDSLLHVHDFRKQFFELNKRFKYIFVDEAHRFKSEDARRTMSLTGRRDVKLGKGRKAEKVFWKGFHHIADHIIDLSGTPMPNRPLELYPLISRHAPHALNFLDPHRFGTRFCAGFESDWGWDYTGNSNLDELHDILTRNFMLVKRLEDCVDLPKILPPQFLYIDDDRGAYAKDEMQLLKTLRITDILQLVSSQDEAFKRRMHDALEDNPEIGGFGFISELRKTLGLSKIKASVKVIKEMLEDDDKIVVFCWHKEVAKRLEEELKAYKPLVIIGGLSDKKRHETVKSFQAENDHRILIANIQAAGVGITLTKSSRVLFVEPSWVPVDNDQAISRCHRIGQTRSVQATYLVVKNSLDHLILNAHINKNEVIKAAIKPRL